jgi:hypothetical protein
MRLNSFWEYLGHYGIGLAFFVAPAIFAYLQFFERLSGDLGGVDLIMAFFFGVGVFFCVQQWRALRCDKVSTRNSAQVNYRKVSKLFRRMRWQVRRKQDGKFIQAVSNPSCFSNGEAVTAYFEGSDVYVNSIYDPQAKNGGGRGKRNAKNMRVVERIVTR